MKTYDVIIIGTGPAGLAAAFSLLQKKPALKLALIDKNRYSSGGLRNDCKMNFSWPVGFPEHDWNKDRAEYYLSMVEDFLKPDIMERRSVSLYSQRAERLGVRLLDIRQSHLGTDGGLALIKNLTARLEALGADICLGETVTSIKAEKNTVLTNQKELSYKGCLVAPGRAGFGFLQDVMRKNGIGYIDNVVDIGIRVELKEERYPIVKDYYDPKFLFPNKVRTFCTNSRSAQVVKEKYEDEAGLWYSVNGHAWSNGRQANGLANFAMLKTIALTEPLASGQAYARAIGSQAMLLGGGQPMMQRVGDFRLGKRSSKNSFNGDLYDFEPSLASAMPGDLGLAVPSKIMRDIWAALKWLDTIVPGVLHPSTVLYYPEIKTYANRPVFADASCFRAMPGLYLAGDGAGTSRGISAAWASGLRAADGMAAELGL